MGHLGLFWARFWALGVAFWNPLTLYAHQLVNASTLQPVARQHLETRAGGLRAERLNNLVLDEGITSWDLKHWIPCQKLRICSNYEDCKSESRSNYLNVYALVSLIKNDSRVVPVFWFLGLRTLSTHIKTYTNTNTHLS